MFLNKTLKSLSKNKWDVFVVSLYLAIIYFSISALVFMKRNPLAKLYGTQYLKYPIKIMKFERMEEYQYSCENFMNILEREGLSCK